MFIINDKNQIFNGFYFTYLEKDENIEKYNLQDPDITKLIEAVNNMGCKITRYEKAEDVKIKRVEIVSYEEAIEDTIGTEKILLCNDIAEIDEDIYNDVGIINYNCDEEGNYPEIFQYFLCRLNQYNINYIKEMYPKIIIGFSQKLKLDVLMVDNFGTNWKYVNTYKFINE